MSPFTLVKVPGCPANRIPTGDLDKFICNHPDAHIIDTGKAGNTSGGERPDSNNAPVLTEYPTRMSKAALVNELRVEHNFRPPASWSRKELIAKVKERRTTSS